MKLNVATMVFFGRKEKLEDRRLLASMDAMNGAIIHQIDNGKSLFIVARRNIKNTTSRLITGNDFSRT